MPIDAIIPPASPTTPDPLTPVVGVVSGTTPGALGAAVGVVSGTTPDVLEPVVEAGGVGSPDPLEPASPTPVVYPPGPAGASAYEVAVDNGFVGTPVEWLASLAAAAGVSYREIPYNTTSIPVVGDVLVTVAGYEAIYMVHNDMSGTWQGDANAMETIQEEPGTNKWAITAHGEVFYSELPAINYASPADVVNWENIGSVAVTVVTPPVLTENFVFVKPEARMYYRLPLSGGYERIENGALPKLLASNNLSDLQNYTTALANLGGGGSVSAGGIKLFTQPTDNAARGVIARTGGSVSGTTVTLSSGYFFAVVRFTHASGCTITLPTGLGAGVEEITLVRQGGALALSNPGVTVENVANVAACPVGGNVTLKRISTNTWIALS